MATDLCAGPTRKQRARRPARRPTRTAPRPGASVRQCRVPNPTVLWARARTISVASMRVPTMRMRTSAPACTRTSSSALTNAGSSVDTKSKSSGMRWLDTNSCRGPASAKKPTCAPGAAAQRGLCRRAARARARVRGPPWQPSLPRCNSQPLADQLFPRNSACSGRKHRAGMLRASGRPDRRARLVHRADHAVDHLAAEGSEY